MALIMILRYVSEKMVNSNFGENHFITLTSSNEQYLSFDAKSGHRNLSFDKIRATRHFNLFCVQRPHEMLHGGGRSMLCHSVTMATNHSNKTFCMVQTIIMSLDENICEAFEREHVSKTTTAWQKFLATILHLAMTVSRFIHQY